MTDTEARFWAKVKKGKHWLWQGRPNGHGYGRMSVNGKSMYAHVLSYIIHKGPIPPGLQIDHLCRVRMCVNPKHLEAVTQRTNLLRGIGPAAVNAKKTHCPAGHPLSGNNVYVWRGCRRCIKCNTAAQYRYYHGIRP